MKTENLILLGLGGFAIYSLMNKTSFPTDNSGGGITINPTPQNNYIYVTPQGDPITKTAVQTKTQNIYVTPQGATSSAPFGASAINLNNTKVATYPAGAPFTKAPTSKADIPTSLNIIKQVKFDTKKAIPFS